ncbi:hypothetical protein [Pseudonocardia zijingensis]|jgi:hypothetical protein
MWFGRRTRGDGDPAAIARATLEAFRDRSDAADEELIDGLRAAGVPHAERAVALLPIAFGRLLLDGLVTLPATFFDGDREVAFADEPLYVAAAQLARTQRQPADIDPIALRSAEVRAVNQALHAGSQPETLVLAPLRMAFA